MHSQRSGEGLQPLLPDLVPISAASTSQPRSGCSATGAVEESHTQAHACTWSLTQQHTQPPREACPAGCGEGQACGGHHHHHHPTPWHSAALPCWCSEEELRRLTQEMGACGAMAYTTVVGAHGGRPLGERYAAVCAAMAMGERIRDGGAHALVVLDDISCMVRGTVGWQS